MEPRFIVDLNVGRLAKWLRVMGYDALFASDIDDGELVRLALREDRVIVTKDSHLTERRVIKSGRLRAVLIKYDDLSSQLRQMIDTLALRENRDFSRRICCNEPLASTSPNAVRELVPPYVFKTQEQFMECPQCRRIYWKGTHWVRMRQELAQISQEAS